MGVQKTILQCCISLVLPNLGGQLTTRLTILPTQLLNPWHLNNFRNKNSLRQNFVKLLNVKQKHTVEWWCKNAVLWTSSNGTGASIAARLSSGASECQKSWWGQVLSCGHNLSPPDWNRVNESVWRQSPNVPIPSNGPVKREEAKGVCTRQQ